MTTDQLIDLLVADLTPVERGRVSQALIIALVAGATAAFSLMFLVFGVRPENFNSRFLDFQLTKLAFTSSVVATTAVFLPRLARPGEPTRSFFATVFVPFVAVALFATVALVSTHWSTWAGVVVGRTWLTCLWFIPLLAVVPFVALVWALRTGAPTDLAPASTAAGLIAGGLGAMACSFPCLDESLPSIAVWYGLTIGICAALGAKLGPGLLRW